MSWLITGCGISQSQYDAVTAELNKTKQDLQTTQIDLKATQTLYQTVQSELTKTKTDLLTAQVDLKAAQGQLQTAQADLKTAQANLKTTQADLKTTQTQLQTAQSDLAKTKTDLQTVQTNYDKFKTDVKPSFIQLNALLAVNNYVIGISRALSLENLDKVNEYSSSLTSIVGAVNDPELTSLWNTAYIVTPQRWDLYYAPYERFLARLQVDISSMMKTFGDSLSQ